MFWHSSRKITLLAMLWSFRHRRGWFENRLSKNITLVVITTGASQFSARRDTSSSDPSFGHSSSGGGFANIGQAVVFEDRSILNAQPQGVLESPVRSGRGCLDTGRRR